MKADIYIQIPQCINVSHPDVFIKDFAKIYCMDFSLKEKIETLPFYQFTQDNDQQIVSTLTVIHQIQNAFPEVRIHNIGETDFILNYMKESKNETRKKIAFTIFICIISFFGGGYAIMSYNTDVGALELFSNLSMLILGNAKKGTLLLTVSYSIGLFIGLITFFNHLGNKKIDADPTPLEIQMHCYENQINSTIISSAKPNK